MGHAKPLDHLNECLVASLKRAVHHGHLPHLTPEVLRRFSLNGVFSVQLVDALREALHKPARHLGVHAVRASEAQIARVDEKLRELNLFRFTPGRKLVSAKGTKAPAVVDLERKATDAAMYWYSKFLTGDREFNEAEVSVFGPDHDAENEVLPVELSL